MKLPNIFNKSIAAFGFLALVAGSFSIPASEASAQTAQYAVYFEAFVDGAMATATTAHNAEFELTGYVNGIESTEDYTLKASGFQGDPSPYQSYHSHLDAGSDFSATATLDGDVVGASCDADAQFSFAGYTSAATMNAAAAATPTMTAPNLTDVSSDNTIILWYNDCENEEEDEEEDNDDGVEGEIGGDVEGGITPGALAVTSIEVLDSTATADGTFANGWKYAFNITVPEDEANLSMKFADWARTTGSGTIAVANNMRISSAEANNSGATIVLTGANTYSTPALQITGDLNSSMDGKQVRVIVEVAIPQNSINGSYTTEYGVQTQP